MDRTVMPDKYMGMLVGSALGDALGAPHEFTRNKDYTGLLVHEVYIASKFHSRSYPAGSVTDDTGMTIALLECLLINGLKYDKNKVILAYMDWSQNWNRGQGKNTRLLFSHPHKRDGIDNYLIAYNSVFTSQPQNTWTQSNGSLMRCSPLAMYPDTTNFIVDCTLSNPHPVNNDCSILYGISLCMAVRGYDRQTVWDYIKDKAQTQEVKDVIEIVIKDLPYEIRGKSVKGHVLRAFYCSLLVFKKKGDDTYYSTKEIIDALAAIPDTDTDTNAAIAGALCGAFEGYDSMMSNEYNKYNIQLLQQVNGLDYQKYRDRLFRS